MDAPSGRPGDAGGEIYVVSHGRHTGFVVPAAPMQSRLAELERRFGDVPYIEFGWGDAGFYRANEITTGLSIRAIFWPTATVVHAVAVPVSPAVYFTGSKVVKIRLDGNGYAALLEFIANSFDRDEQGRIVVLDRGLYGNSQFYRGVGDYYLMNTCNTWTAKGLRSAGLEISTTFKLTAGSVMDALKAPAQAGAGPTDTCCD